MPIYAYKCSACGHEQDVLQKMSDPLLTDCPACHQSTYVKQVTAAAFQLKGTGWYVTDFRDNDKKRSAERPDAGTGASGEAGGTAGSAAADSSASSAATPKPGSAGDSSASSGGGSAGSASGASAPASASSGSTSAGSSVSTSAG